MVISILRIRLKHFITRKKGGMSFFSSRFGFACDNVENYEVCLKTYSHPPVPSTTCPCAQLRLISSTQHLRVPCSALTLFIARLYSHPARLSMPTASRTQISSAP